MDNVEGLGEGRLGSWDVAWSEQGRQATCGEGVGGQGEPDLVPKSWS